MNYVNVVVMMVIMMMIFRAWILSDTYEYDVLYDMVMYAIVSR